MFERMRGRLREIRAAAYAPILGPGEQILATGAVAAAFIGDDQIETAPPDAGRIEQLVQRATDGIEQLPPIPKGFVTAVGAVAAVPGALSLPAPNIDRLLGGRVGEGAAGSVASMFKGGLAGVSRELVVTTGRIGITTDSTDTVEIDTPVPVYAKQFTAVVPRALVLAARRRRRPFEWGRLELVFVDGSRITLTAGVFVTRAANRLFRAITAGTAG